MELLKFFKKSLPTLLFMLLFSVVAIYSFYKIQTPKQVLPIINPVDINPKLVDPSMRGVREHHKIAPFKMIDQNGDTITDKTYSDKIYVADFFFTHCQSICPIMTNYMGQVQEAFKNDDEVMMLSFSVTPDIDSVSVLKAYADKNKVVASKWHMVTGAKKEIYNLARKSYFAVLDEGYGGEQDFIHTEHFILIDKNQQIRGIYDGTNKEAVQKLITDIDILKQSYHKP